MAMHNIEKHIDQFFAELKHTPGPWESLYEGHKIVSKSHWFVPPDNDEDGILTTVISTYGAMGGTDTNTDCKLIAQSPELLRTICRTYLTLLVKFAYGQNDFVNSARISLDGTLADLRNQIATATGLECQYIQDVFEGYVIEIAN